MTNRPRQWLSARVGSTMRQNRKRKAPARIGQADLLIASYNVHKCVGTDNRFDPERTASVIAEIGADILAVQEADQRFGAKAGLLDMERLERECGLVPVPVSGRSHGEGWHGNLLLFRKGTVGDVRQLRLPGVEPRGALVVDLDLAQGPLRIVSAHLGLLRRSRAQQAEAILEALAVGQERPTLILGDLNEWRVGQRSSLLGFDPDFGPLGAALPSFPSRFPLFALDRILGSPHDLITGIDIHSSALARMASDHLPIKAWIDLEGAAAQGRRPLAA